jgi:hypothetical protein
MFACICVHSRPAFALFAYFAVKKTPSNFACIRVHSRFRFPAPPCLRERQPAALDKGDKVTDKARDKVGVADLFRPPAKTVFIAKTVLLETIPAKRMYC